MGLRGLGKKLPPIAWRDEELRRHKDRHKELERELARAEKRVRRLERTGPTPAEMAERVRAADMFDDDWYVAQTGTPPTDPLLHYLTVGDADGLSPHPAFDPTTYRRNLRPRRTSAPTLVHYLTTGRRTGVSPHPRFPAEAYLQHVPACQDHPGGPLGHYLEHGQGGALADGTTLRDPEAFLRLARAAARTARGAADMPTTATDPDWDGALARAADRTDTLSVVVVTSHDPVRAAAAVRRVTETASRAVEVVVVDNHGAPADAVRLQFDLDGLDAVRYHRTSSALPVPAARNVGALLSTGGTLVFLPDTAWVFPGWDGALVQALTSHAVVQPLVLDRGGSIWSAGVSFDGGSAPVHPLRGYAGDAPEARGELVVDGVDTCLCTTADAFLRARGFDPVAEHDLVGADLSLTLRALDQGTAACVGAATVVLRTDPPAPTSAEALDRALGQRRQARELWELSGLHPAHVDIGDGVGVVARRHLDDHGVEPVPLLVRDRTTTPLRWALKIGTQVAFERESWGDWHFALALRDQLERLGHQVTIDTRHAWYRPTAHLDDVVLVLQGRGRYRPSPDHVNLLWLISHPAEAPITAVEDYDVVLGASQRWCDHAARYARTTPELMLQCTDPERFHPGEPDPRCAHEVLMVGNARGPRPAVAAALDAGIVPDVYGQKWQGLVPAEAWKGTYLPNEKLPDHYRSSGVVLNDHWDEMREWGILSNRLFDLAACGARVISDDIPQISQTFADVVLTFDGADDLPGLVRAHLEETPEVAERRAALSERVRLEHSFAARARTLSDRATAHLAAKGLAR